MSKLSRYLRDVVAEFKKVTWPSREKTRQMTILVLAITGIWAIYVALLDLGFGQFINLLIKQ